MAGQSKRRAIEENSDSSDSETDSYAGQNEILTDFEGRNLETHDFDGIKQLLKQIFLKSHLDLSELTDLLIAQQNLGSVLKQSYDEGDDDDDDDDDITENNTVFGITSVLNITNNMISKSIQQLIALLSELSIKYGSESSQKFVKEILENKSKIGLLINERFVNIPAKIADPLFTSLYGELDKMKKKNSSYDFDYFVMICKMYKPKNEGTMQFTNQEEEIFSKESLHSFEFDVGTESDTGFGGKWTEDDDELVPYRRVLFFPAKKLPSILQQVKQYVA